MIQSGLFNIAEKSIVNEEITKQLHVKLSHDAAELFNNQVSKAIWYASIRPQETDIDTFEDESKKYEEIQIIELTLNGCSDVVSIAKYVMNCIPYPLLIVFLYNNKVKLCMSKLKKAQAGYKNYIISSILSTIWIYPNDLSDQDFTLFPSLFLNFNEGKSIYDLHSRLYDTILTHQSQSMTRARTYRIVDYLLGKTSTIKKAEIFQSCDINNWNPPSNQGKNAIFANRSSNHLCLHDYGDIWHCLITRNETRKVLLGRKIMDMEALLLKMDEYEMKYNPWG